VRLLRQAGLTLVELLVAVAVFSVLAAIAYQGLVSVANASAALGQEGERFARLQFAISLLERDLRQALPRPVRDQLGDPVPAMAGSNLQLRLTRAGWNNPIGQQRADLERIQLQLEDDALIRLSWSVLDRSRGSRPSRQTLLEGVGDLRFRFLDQSLEWQNEWPPVRGLEDAGDEPWPLAVSIRLDSEHYGSIERLFSLVAMPRPTLRPGATATGDEAAESADGT
jgi:general secretion pathway protein J